LYLQIVVTLGYLKSVWFELSTSSVQDACRDGIKQIPRALSAMRGVDFETWAHVSHLPPPPYKPLDVVLPTTVEAGRGSRRRMLRRLYYDRDRWYSTLTRPDPTA
jgi:hypothetical protein